MRILFVFILMYSGILYAQDYPYSVDRYAFIRYNKNKLTGTDSLPGFNSFYKQWKNLITTGKGQVNILHLGDSHIQADFFTGRIRQRLQEFFPGCEGARGLIFPYNLAATNNPGNYRITSPNKWKVVNSVKTETPPDGIIPAKVYATDSVITLKIRQNDSLLNSGFNSIELWYAAKGNLKLVTPRRHTVDMLPGYGSITVKLDSIRKNATLKITGAGKNHPFELYAVALKNQLPGITYQALGLNGATSEDFTNCSHLKKFLRYTEPDLIVISLGTNDLYDPNANMENFTLYYGRLIQQIRQVFPRKALILTTPGDHFIHGYMPDKQLKTAGKTIKNLAKRFEAAVWDFYTIMGGYKAMMDWHFHGLAADDKVHLSKKGYMLQGDLFFNALLKSFEKAVMPREHSRKIFEGVKHQ